MAGLEFANRLVRSQRRRNTGEGEIMMNRFIVYVPADVRVLEQSHEFGSKGELAFELRVQQRFLSHPIAREKKRLRSLIPDRKGEHPAQIPGTISAVFI